MLFFLGSRGTQEIIYYVLKKKNAAPLRTRKGKGTKRKGRKGRRKGNEKQKKKKKKEKGGKEGGEWGIGWGKKKGG